MLQSPGGVSTHTVTKVQPGLTGTVISAPASTPVIPAMPLDEDPSKLCRHSLKCLECNEVFQDETSLATHFQQAADTSGQVEYHTFTFQCFTSKPRRLRIWVYFDLAVIYLNLRD